MNKVLDQSLSVEPLDLLTAANTPQLRSILMDGFSELIMRKVCFDILKSLRCKVRILSCVNGVVSHEAALSGLPNLMLAGVVEMKPAPGSMIVCVEGDLVGALVDEICGSTSSEMYARNELSNMEIRYGKKLIDITANAVVEVFSNFMPITRAVTNYETASGMLSIAESQTWMVSATGILETELGFGSITVIATHAGLEPVEMRMITRSGPGGAEGDDNWFQTLGRISEYTPIELRVEVARALVPLHVIEAVDIGQILPFYLLSDAIVMTGDIDALQASYGQADGNACIRIVGPLQREGAALITPRASVTVGGGDRGALPRAAPANRPLRLIENVMLAVSVELGRTKILLKDFRDLAAGQVVILDQRSNEPLKIYANGRFFATGDVVAVGPDKYGIRVVSLEHALEGAVAV
jgi:flagellar motor switch protein FliM